MDVLGLILKNHLGRHFNSLSFPPKTLRNRIKGLFDLTSVHPGIKKARISFQFGPPRRISMSPPLGGISRPILRIDVFNKPHKPARLA